MSLVEAVKEICEGYDDGDGLDGFISDLRQVGCQSGLVSEMVYYSDTLKFYEKHKEEINEMLSEMMNEMGVSCPTELFGDKWDDDDALALNTNNQNLLAWFAFESVAFSEYS